MNLPNTVTLSEVIRTTMYFDDNQELIKDLQKWDKFNLTEQQENEFDSFLDELREFIDGIYEKYGGELSGMNTEEDTYMICNELKVNPNHPTIVYDKNGNSKLNTYFHETA
jgi:hypothetical protein